jgi:hypothetical protein
MSSGETHSSGASDASASSDSSDSTNSLDGEPELALKMTDALCEWAYGCCTDDELDSLVGPHFKDHVSDCKDRMEVALNSGDNNSDPATDYNLDRIDPLLTFIAHHYYYDRAHTIYDGIVACEAELKARKCNEDPLVSAASCVPYGDDPCSLTNLFRGWVPKGGECNQDLLGPEHDIECVYGTSCEAIEAGPDSPFRCVAKGLAGDPCDPSHNGEPVEGPCEYGLYCSPEGSCTPLHKVGESCAFADPNKPHVTDWQNLYAMGADLNETLGKYKGNETIPCEVGLNCDPLALKCVSWCDEGAICAPPAANDGWAGSVSKIDKDGIGAELKCRDDLSCVPHEFAANAGNYYFRCAPPRTVAGGLCNDDGDCAASLYCHGLSDAKPGTCVKRPARGEACDETLTPCGAGDFCGACGLLEHRIESSNGDLKSGDPGACDQDDDGDIDEDDDAIDSTLFVCQPLLPTSTKADHICAGTLGAHSGDVIRYDEVECESGSWCALTNELSNGTSVDAAYYCISKELGADVECAPGERDNYLEGGYFATNQSAQLPWSNSCADEWICEDPANTTPTCHLGVTEGKDCDYDPATASKGHCQSGLHCVFGVCQRFLQPGEVCNKDNNIWDTSDETIKANGFEGRRCDPHSASCQQVHGNYYCEVFSAAPEVKYYCGGRVRD